MIMQWLACSYVLTVLYGAVAFVSPRKIAMERFSDVMCSQAEVVTNVHTMVARAG